MMWNKTQQTARFLKDFGMNNPEFGIVLGSGLGGLVEKIDIINRLSYEEIPNFPVSTVEGHAGELIFGKLSGKLVLAMRGRFHYYEGWSIQETVFPIRVMKAMGIQKLIVSNASGGVNPKFSVGDIMLITDHINMMPEHPLRGNNDTRFGPRFVDMHESYNQEMLRLAEQVANDLEIPVQKGIYMALQGPTFETPAEYKMVFNLGADAVGMSTVPEVIVAKHMGMDCMGASVITDLGVDGQVVEVSHEEVQEVAEQSGELLSNIVEEFVARA